MDLSNLRPAVGSTTRETRVGRGPGSGKGGTSTRGHKGAKSRSGYSRKIGFEGGQMPLQRRLPKRGFKNFPFKVEYAVINLDRLIASFEGKREISLEDIYERGLCKFGAAVKILGVGEVGAALAVEAHKFSKSAAEKIRAAGGEVRELEVCACEAESSQAQEG